MCNRRHYTAVLYEVHEVYEGFSQGGSRRDISREGSFKGNCSPIAFPSKTRRVCSAQDAVEAIDKKLKSAAVFRKGTNMTLLTFFEKLFASHEPLSNTEEAYVEACVDEALGRPNPWLLPQATSHSHVITILDFMQEDPFLHTWVPSHTSSILDDPRFQLNSIVWTL